MLMLAILLQAAAAPCPAVPVAPPAELTGWGGKGLVGASADKVQRFRVGSFARAMLLPAAAVTLPARPGKPAAAGSSSGVFAVEVPAAGRYRVALGAGAWLDLVRGGKALTSVAHGHGPACTGIRKTVDFDLKPGLHLLQIVGSPTPAIDMMVARLK